MTILGVGLDLVAIARVQRLLDSKGQHALGRLLTDAERSYCLGQPAPARHVAARLAAKEAAYKAFQAAAGTRGIGWREVEIVRDPEGRPALRFHGRGLAAASALRVDSAFLSISHTDENAAAVVILSTA
ncbi:MAG: holo-ACP synthase [Gemmatimonadetes bacterium]|nr:holo-ACP synthase [Gemmatimonadota bacterium]